MTPSEFRHIRTSMGMELVPFARELGYNGRDSSDAYLIQQYERGKKPIPAYIARLAYLIHEHFTTEEGYLPDWPESCAHLPPKPSGEKRR